MSDHADDHAHCEVFTFTLLPARWCIDLVREQMAANPEGATLHEQADITGLRGWVRMMSVNPEHAATVDLSEPLMVASLRTDAGEDVGPLVINGWHRVHRALSEGRTHLPAWLLTPELERSARIEIWR